MITFYTTCKPFNTSRIIQIQHDAISSWLELKPRPEVVVMGRDAGSADFCRMKGITNFVDMEYNEYGIPLLSSMLEKAEEISQNNLFLLISSDIVIEQKVMTALEIIRSQLQEFCAVCRRTETDCRFPIEFFDPDWFKKIGEDPTNHYCSLTSGDFFMYSRGYWPKMPKFSVGRCWCDSWLFYEASQKGNLVDLTEFTPIYHIRHDYSHLYESNEFETNKALCDNRIGDVSSANWIVTKEGILVRK